jgi:uncharacterized BrkB/YihY/UPF0761 family membrane protein
MKGVFIMAWFFIVFIIVIFGVALYIEFRNKRNNNNPHIPTNPNAKPGDSTNYLMGDNKYIGGGG